LSKPSLAIVGLGPGSIDELSVGTLRKLQQFAADCQPILLRTSRHPCVIGLETAGVRWTHSFDEIYNASASFDNVYEKIAESIVSIVRARGTAAYLVPGHPLIGEKTVELLLLNQTEFDIDIIAGTSFIEACLAAARLEVSCMNVVDALTIPNFDNPYAKPASPFNLPNPHLIYQVYDRQIASIVKIALLEELSPDSEVLIISNAGAAGSETVTRTELSRLDFSDKTFDHLTSVLVPGYIQSDQNGRFDTLLDIMAKLRHPTSGCPWDREQTPKTLKRYAVEEVYEVLDAIDDADTEKYVEELGDLLLQVVFHAQLARESGDFTIEDVVRGITEKLIRRHPHVFGEVVVSGSEEVLTNWELIKRDEKGNVDRTSRLDGVPRGLPALSQALEISKRAAKAGFEWDSIDGVFDKLNEELVELKEALLHGNHDNAKSELGDLLFTVVNIARFIKTDAEDALRIMVKRFSERFRHMEISSTKPLEELTTAELEGLWQGAKREQSRVS
jgi:tetrapyrrole methylase family protein/MazG family protein